MKLGELLEAYMKVNGLSYRTVAREIGCDHSTLHRLIHGEPVRMSVFNKLMNWLTQTPQIKT